MRFLLPSIKCSAAPPSFRLLASTVSLSELCTAIWLPRARQWSEAGRSCLPACGSEKSRAFYCYSVEYMEHLEELRFQLAPRDARCWGHINQVSTFRCCAKIDALASKSSPSFSIPVMENNDLCLEMSRLQLSNGTISADLVLVLSFVSEPQWPPTMGRNEHVLFSMALLRQTVQLCQNRSLRRSKDWSCWCYFFFPCQERYVLYWQHGTN